MAAAPLVGLGGPPGRPAWAIEEQATQIHRVWALQVQDSVAAELEPARRKAVSVKVELRCNCSRESAQVERACILLNDVVCSCQLFSTFAITE